MRVASNRPRFDSRRAWIACELSETALYSSIRSRPSAVHACTRSQDKRSLCKREFHSARPMVDAVPVVSVLSRLRASVPRRDRSSLAARIDARRFGLVLTGRAGYAKQGEGPGWMTVNGCKTEKKEQRDCDCRFLRTAPLPSYFDKLIEAFTTYFVFLRHFGYTYRRFDT